MKTEKNNSGQQKKKIKIETHEPHYKANVYSEGQVFSASIMAPFVFFELENR